MSDGAITHVRYVGLGVKDFVSQQEFYRDWWGLEERESDSGVVYFGAVSTGDPHILRLRRSDEDRLDVVSLSVPNAVEVDRAATRLRNADAHFISSPGEHFGPGGGYGFRFFDLDGRTLEILADVTPASSRPLKEREWHPGKLSHVVLNSTNIEHAARWYAINLGLHISDRLADRMIFLRGDNNAHHIMAIAHNRHISLNHVAYETRGIDEYLRASGRLMRAGLPCVWGPGRHGPGDNTFAYFSDHSGFVAEYTTALQVVDDWGLWTPRVHSVEPEWSDQWGTANIRNPEPFIGRPDPGTFIAPPI